MCVLYLKHCLSWKNLFLFIQKTKQNYDFFFFGKLFFVRHSSQRIMPMFLKNFLAEIVRSSKLQISSNILQYFLSRASVRPVKKIYLYTQERNNWIYVMKILIIYFITLDKSTFKIKDCLMLFWSHKIFIEFYLKI